MAENEVIQEEPIIEDEVVETEEVVETAEVDSTEELEEKAFGAGNDVPDPVVKGSNKRGADKTAGETATPSLTKSQMLSGVLSAMTGMNKADISNVYASVVSKAPARKADKGGAGDPMPKIKMAEDVAEMFAGQDLSEEFIESATTIFEAAVNARLTAEQARLEEEFEQKLDEAKDSSKAELAEKIDDYLNYVVEEWVKDNQLAIETSLKSEVTESFILGLKGLFENHYIDVPEEKLDILGELNAKVEELEKKLDEQIDANIELKGQLDEATRRAIFDEVSEGLAMTQIEKLKTLSEGIEFDSAEVFHKKLEVIRENYFKAGEKKQAVLEEEVIAAENDEDESVVATDPAMSKYVSAISRTLKK